MRHSRRSALPSNPRSPTPRWITLRWPVCCAGCGAYLARGETAYYDPATKRVWGASCGHAQAGADEVAKRPHHEPEMDEPKSAFEHELEQESGRERDGGF